MPLALRNDLYFCLTDRGAIFFDLAANRYFGLSNAADHAFRRIIAGDALDQSLEEQLKPMFAKGLVHHAESVVGLSAPVLDAPRIATFGAGGAVNLPNTVRALATHGAIRAEMRLSGLRAVVRRRRDRRSAAPGSPDGALISNHTNSILAAHLAVDRLLGGANRCLPRSLALTDDLAKSGFYPKVVIGVRLGAFAAHCWVQHESTVLNDELDRVRLFTPILIL